MLIVYTKKILLTEFFYLFYHYSTHYFSKKKLTFLISFFKSRQIHFKALTNVIRSNQKLYDQKS